VIPATPTIFFFRRDDGNISSLLDVPRIQILLGPYRGNFYRTSLAMADAPLCFPLQKSGYSFLSFFMTTFRLNFLSTQPLSPLEKARLKQLNQSYFFMLRAAVLSTPNLALFPPGGWSASGASAGHFPAFPFLQELFQPDMGGHAFRTRGKALFAMA